MDRLQLPALALIPQISDAAIMLAVMSSAHSLGPRVCHPSLCLLAYEHPITMAAWIEADGQRSLCRECRLVVALDAQLMWRGPSHSLAFTYGPIPSQPEALEPSEVCQTRT